MYGFQDLHGCVSKYIHFKMPFCLHTRFSLFQCKRKVKTCYNNCVFNQKRGCVNKALIFGCANHVFIYVSVKYKKWSWSLWRQKVASEYPSISHFIKKVYQ